MPNERLRKSLEQLRSELDQGDLSDPELKTRLDTLIGDIEVKLDKPDDDEHHDTLVRSLQEGVRQFELKHQRTAMLLNRVMLALGEAGI